MPETTQEECPVFAIRVLCGPKDVGLIVHDLARAFVVRDVQQLPANNGDLQCLYVQAERRADAAAK
jgi:hypothetical protein